MARIDIHQKFVGTRVYLEIFQIHHVEAVLHYKERNQNFFQPFQNPLPLHDLTRDTQTRWIQAGLKQVDCDTEYPFGVFLRGSDNLVGRIHLSEVSRGPFQNGVIGYSMDEAYNGQGLMTEAVRLFQHIAFGPLGLHRLQGAVMTQNTASIRVLIKTGFRCEGYAPRYLLINRRWEDHWIYACLNDAWRSSPNAP